MGRTSSDVRPFCVPNYRIYFRGAWWVWFGGGIMGWWVQGMGPRNVKCQVWTDRIY